MFYRFDRFELDTATMELRRSGETVRVEPQVFSLLVLLLENRDRVVPKEEIVASIWSGRVISDAALSSRIKSLRQALDDDGRTQAIIRTLHGRGFRFVGTLCEPAASDVTVLEPPTPEPAPEAARSPTIAVLPFEVLASDETYGVLGDALPAELISSLSCLRWLSVIARGSSFRFRGAARDSREIGQTLGAAYYLAGAIEIFGGQAAVTIELVDTKDGRVIWSERYTSPLAALHELRDAMNGNIVAALETRIPLHEAQQARFRNPDTLDAWAAYHVGLQHMYRFNRDDNELATYKFEQALRQDGKFARALAALSFTHFQNAFLRYNAHGAQEEDLARRYAEQAMELDPLDPFCNYALGRSYWLAGDLDGGLGWLERATAISPSFAQGLYARGWTDALSGRGASGRESVDAAMKLSPLDPLLYAMRATRSFTFIVDGDDRCAALWAEHAARSPGAHVLIAMIAAAMHALSGNTDKARYWVEQVRRQRPDLTRGDFFHAFPFACEPARSRLERALLEHGF